MKGILALILAVAAVGSAATIGSAKSTPTGGRLHVTKECSQYTGEAESFCTIVSANIPEIKTGMRVVYASAPSDGTLDSDIVLSSTDGSASEAYGHVILDFAKFKGRVTFSGGIGALAGFQADAKVSLDSSGAWHWDGSYSIGE
jgi:hypothetical protein